MSFNFRISNFGISSTVNCCNSLLIITANTIVTKVGIGNVNTGSTVNTSCSIVSDITIIYMSNTIGNNSDSILTAITDNIRISYKKIRTGFNSSTIIISEITIVYMSNSCTSDSDRTFRTVSCKLTVSDFRVSTTVNISTFIISEITIIYSSIALTANNSRSTILICSVTFENTIL